MMSQCDVTKMSMQVLIVTPKCLWQMFDSYEELASSKSNPIYCELVIMFWSGVVWTSPKCDIAITFWFGEIMTSPKCNIGITFSFGGVWTSPKCNVAITFRFGVVENRMQRIYGGSNFLLHVLFSTAHYMSFIMYFIYHPPTLSKSSGTASDFYAELECLFICHYWRLQSLF